MANMKNIIDSHVHLDLIEQYHPHRIKWLKDNDCIVVSWAYFEGVDSVLKLRDCLEYKAQCIRKHYADGLKCYYLAGVHPRSIPQDLKPETIESLLEPYIDDPLCLGIGEIGFETFDAKEREIFIAQIELGKNFLKRGKIIGVHTSRTNKLSATESTLKILDHFTDIAPSLVIDHCSIETIDAVLNAGFWAGVTLSKIKTSWDDMKNIVSTHSDKIDRIMCNTDSGTKFFEDVLKFKNFYGVPADISEKIFYLNAAQFFKIH
ncbi:MAG: TatD family hydrolase [Proteobacteria bacterium]|nr:TatD family hydrolase [Pseudomonadota bacterium]